MFKEYFAAPRLPETDYPGDSIGAQIVQNADQQESPEGFTLALIGVEEERGSWRNNGCSQGVDYIRHEFYQLKAHRDFRSVIDLGNLIPGLTLNDTYSALASIGAELLPAKVIPVLIGGSQDLTYGLYSAYRKLEQIINIVSLDARFDLGLPEDELHSASYIGKIILEQPNYLFNFSNLGYQSYLVGNESIDLMKRLHFESHRLGLVQAELGDAEPVVRNADLLSVDLSSVRQSDSPGSALVSPNGLYGEEACQIMMYAGYSDKLSSLGLFEYNPAYDRNYQSARLAAQMIWYFMEGVFNRRQDIPQNNPNQYITYRVAINQHESEIEFIKSIRTDRWWIRLPMEGNRNRYASHRLLPCTYRDYEQACRNEVPDRWWNAIRKLR